MTGANWDLFRLFFAVAKVGSVNRAARALGMSQPTLSRRLNELERYVGAPLFFRVSSGVRLTPEGEQLSRVAGGMVQSFEAFQRDLSDAVGDRAAAIKISAPEGLTRHWLLPRVRRLRSLNNNVRLEIVSTVQQQDVAESDLDFVIRMGHPGENELVGKRVATAIFGLFASQAYLAQHPAPQSIEELADHDLISGSSEISLHSERTGQMPLLSQFLAASNTRGGLQIMPIINHFAAASEGLGLAFLAVPFASAEGLVQVLPDRTAAMDVWLLRRRESDLRKSTRQVRRFLESEFLVSRPWFLGRRSIELVERIA